MNALVALLHFCEVHGPCVVYCTQAIHSNSPSIIENENCNNASPPISILQSKHPAAPTQQQASSTSTTHSSASLRRNPSSSPSNAALTHTGSASASASTLAAAPSTTCAACTAQLPLINNGTSITEAKRLVTIDDDDPTIQYIGTSKCPQQPHLYKAVRLACVRSLTAEFCQGRDGPVLFGDDENGHVMSYMFKLRDAQARGEARFYALMMLMTDRVYLVSCWPLLLGAFRSMSLNLQERANVVFQREKESMRQITHRRAPITSQDQFYRRRSHTALRSLVDLLGIKVCVFFKIFSLSLSLSLSLWWLIHAYS
ncbi:vesicle coat protein [Parasitella parasitica]|nr:vesicle coat protein [Parasitella parasitica]